MYHKILLFKLNILSNIFVLTKIYFISLYVFIWSVSNA